MIDRLDALLWGQLAQPSFVEAELRAFAFHFGKRAVTGGGFDVQNRDLHQFDNRCAAMRRGAQHALIHAEESRENVAIALVQIPRAAFADVLLDVGDIATEEPRNSRVGAALSG